MVSGSGDAASVGRFRRGPRTWLQSAAVLLSLAGIGAADVTIYRIGGEDLPPPAALGQPGVRFRQLPWNGDTAQLDRVRATASGLGPRTYETFTALPLRDSNPDLTPLFDRDRFGLVCGLCATLTVRSSQCGVCRGIYPVQGAINIRLPEPLFVERVRISSGDADGLGILEDFALHLSPSPLARDAEPAHPLDVEVRDNLRRDVEFEFEPDRRTATVQLALAEHERAVVIHEVMVHASGVASRALYTSDVVDHGKPAVWGGLRWSVQPAEGSRVAITGRSGDQGQSLLYWRYTGIGDQKVRVTQDEYYSLFSSERAGASYDYGSWTAWPALYDLAGGGQPPLPAGPRRALQLRLQIDSESVEGSRVAWIEFRGSDPAVSAVVGELDPIRAEPGAATAFRYTLKPTIGDRDAGFDRVEIRATAAHIDSVSGFQVDDIDRPFTVRALEPGRLLVEFARLGEEATDALVVVRFQARAMRYGASFAAFLLDSARPHDVAQPVLPGDAVDEVFSDRVWIETGVAVRDLLTATATPAVFTPNGDGIGDEATIAYDLFEATGNVAVRVVIHDLAGRPVRHLDDHLATIGRYESTWDGRDDSGRLVPPGIYLYRVHADIRQTLATRAGLVHVLY